MTGIQAVGVVMTTALMVTPAATASLITRRLVPMFFWAVVCSWGACLSGLFASYYLHISSGGAIVLSATLLFAFVFVMDYLIRRRQRQPDRVLKEVERERCSA